MSLLFFWANFLAYFVVFFLSVIFLRDRKMFSLIYGVWAFSSLTTLFFIENADQEVLHVSVSEWPFVYLFLCLGLLTWPLLCLKSKKIKLGSMTSKISQLSFLDTFIVLLGVILFFPTIENFFLALTIDTNALETIYNRDNSGIDIYHRLSFYSRNANRLVHIVFYIAPFLLFWELVKVKIEKRNIICISIILLDIFLTSYNSAARTEFVKLGISLFVYYLFFKQKIPYNRLKKFNFYALIAISMGVVGISLITLSRFTQMNSYSNIWGWVSLYTGEGFCRFEDLMWHKSNVIMCGDNTFPLFKQLLGFDTFTDAVERRDFWEPQIGIPNNIFYTFIGDFYVDYGSVFTPLVFFFTGILVYKLISSMQIKLHLFHIVIFNLFMLTILFGVMHFVFKVYMDQYRLLGALLFAFILYQNEKNESRNINLSSCS